MILLLDTGNIYAWGRGCLGKLGNGDDADVYTPYHVSIISNCGIGKL